MPNYWAREPLTFVFLMLSGILKVEGGQSDDLKALEDIISEYHNIEFFDVDTLEVIYFALVRNYKVIKETLSLEAYNEFSAIYKAISNQYFKLKIENHE